MIKRLFYLLLFLSTANIRGQVVADLDWIQYHSDKSNINNVPTALDAISNAYSTGYVNTSPTVVAMRTLKYDSLGNNVFAVTYSGGSYDQGNAIKVDASGNVYCTGTSYNGSQNRNYITIKYSPTGSQLWAVQYNGAGNNIDEAYDLQLDASANVYITGKSRGPSGNYNIVTIKYNSSGSLQWVHTFDNGYDDIGVGLSISPNGTRVYVTGNSNNASNSDIVTYELNASTGAIGWSNIVAGSGSSTDKVSAIKMAGTNIVICGYLYSTTNNYVTIKYSSTGSSLWQNSYGFTSTSDDRATALVVDSTGNIAVTGTMKQSTGAYEYHTVLYSPSGTQLWVNKESTGLTTIDVEPQIATDTIANHFYVCGQIQKASSDVFVYQITPGGNSTWKQAIDGQDSGPDAATNLCVNGIGEIFLSAQCRNIASNYDITTMKIGQTPVYPPVDNLNETPIEGCAFVENKGQLLDESGVSVPPTTVQYYTENTTPHFFFKDTQMEMIFAHYDNVASTNDTLQKVKVNFFRSNPHTKLYAHDQYVANKGYFIPQFPDGIKNIKSSKYLLIPNIYPYIDLHYSSNVNGVKYYFVVKPGGNPALIEHQFTGASSTGTVTGGNLGINTPIGSIQFEPAYAYQVMPIGMTSYSVIPLAWTGNWVNSGTNRYQFNIGSYNPALPLVFEVDQGNAIVTAPSAANNTWNTYVGGDRDEEFTDLKIDPNGNIYTLQDTKSGAWYTTPLTLVGNPIPFVNGAQVYKFNKFGVLVAQTYFGGGANGLFSSAIAVQSDSSVIITGRFASSIPPITGPANSYTTSTGASFILKYATNIQTLQWSTRYPGFIQDVDVNSNNDIYVLATASKTGSNAAYLSTKANALNLNTGNITGSQANVVSRFNSNGVTNWSSFIPVMANIGGIKVDKKRNVYYVFGRTTDTTDFEHFNHFSTFYQPVKNSNADAFVQKFTSGDTIKVSTLYGGNDDDTFYEGETMSNGDLYLVGTSFSNNSVLNFNPGGAYVNPTGVQPTRTRGFITRFDSIMTRKWSTTYGDSTKNSGFRGVCRDSTNNVYVGGFSYGMPTDNSLLNAYFQGTGTPGNSCLLRFDANNQRNWATYMGGSVSMAGMKSIGYNPVNNNLCFSGGAGTSGSSYPFANFTNPQAYWQPLNYNNNYYDAFVGRFALVGVFVGIEENHSDRKDRSGLFVYPNPTNDLVTLRIDTKVNKPYVINVLNVLGQMVYTEAVQTGYEQPRNLALSHLTNGVYFINVVSEEMNKTAKIVKE